MSQSPKRSVLTIGIFLILAGVILRVARHYGLIDLPPNFAPVSAIAMFGAVLLPRRWALIVPFVLMFASDWLIGFYHLPIMLTVYASFGASILIGWWLRRRVTTGRVLGSSLVGSILFFLATNAADWGFGNWYPHTMAGLIQAYAAGLPFFRNTVLGDLIYTGVAFGVYGAVMVYFRRRATVTATANGQ